MNSKFKFTIAQEESKTATVNIETIRSGRFTTGDAIVALTLPQHGKIFFRGLGATVRDAIDKDSPELAHALAVARALKQLARNIETAAMEEVHSRCATIDPIKRLSNDELLDIVDACDFEIGLRISKEQEDEAKKAVFLAEANRTPRDVVLRRREERKAAKRAQNAAKYGKIEEIQF